MREIKFRAWDKNSKNIINNFAHIGTSGRMYTIHHIGNENEYEVMQYTGLKDKNGKEIYEGDIVRINIPVDENNPLITNGIFQVIFDKGMFCISIPEGNYPLSDYLHQDCEVIGNIYENPELLTNPL